MNKFCFFSSFRLFTKVVVQVDHLHGSLDQKPCVKDMPGPLVPSGGETTKAAGKRA